MKKAIAVLSLSFLPMLAFADATVGSVITLLGTWLKALLPITTGIALLVFIWGMVIFISKSGDSEARAEGRQRMVWGVIALFVIVSIWGLVGFIGNTFSVYQNGSGTAPSLPYDATFVGPR